MQAGQPWRPTLLAVAMIVMAGCQESPTASSLRVAEARSQGERDLATVRREATEHYLQASADVEAARARARQVALDGEREIALTKARADYEVGIKACDALGGEARSACRVQEENRHRAAAEAARRIAYADAD